MMVPQQQRRRRRRAALPRIPERRVIVARGAGGFGFTIAGQRPCIVSAVAIGGPADRAGLRAGDALIAVDGASVSRAPHAAVARLVAGAPQAISLSVAPREAPPTDTEDTEPDERARTRRRHPPPRRRPHQPPLIHQPGCQAVPSTSIVNEILQNLSRAQLSPSAQAARLECRAVVGYLGTIETPSAAVETAPSSVKSAVRRLRQERRPAANVLLSVLPNVLILRRPTGQTLAQYNRERIVYAGCSSDSDRRYFGLVTSAEVEDNENEVSHSCHVFSVDPRLAEHEAHLSRAREFQITCTRDPVAERCLEFPPSAEYVVGVVRGMYSLPSGDCASPALQQLSKLAIKGASPAAGNFSRCHRAGLRMPRMAPRPNGLEDGRLEPQDFVANSPQPSNHSEMTTTSSNSDSGIGFHNDGRNVADRILVVEFAGQPPINRFRADMPRRPMGMVGCNFEDASFLSNTTPVVDGFGGQGRPLNHLEDIMLNANEVQHPQSIYMGPKTEDKQPTDNYNYNGSHYNMACSSKMSQNGIYENVQLDNEVHYELIPPRFDLDLDRVAESLNSVEIYEDKRSCQSNESVENVTVISGTASKASMDSVSMYSSRSHEEARPPRRRHLQASLDDMLVLGLRDEDKQNDDDNFIHPASVKLKSRKSKHMNLLAKTKNMLIGGRQGRRSLSASAGDVTERDDTNITASEPDLRDNQSEQSSPFRRWTTGNGSGSSYRHHDHRNIYNKQMSDGSPSTPGSPPSPGGVARWALGLEQLLADPAGAAAFAHFLHNEFAGENIRFWWSCEQYRTSPAEARGQLARDIWRRHLEDGAPEPVNVDAAARRAACPRDDPPADLFLQTQKQIFNVMKFDSYPRFLRSPIHAECARADLCGLPSPYAARDGSHTKLKKSASNASERRRSGGSSLLPWKMRTASKDRAVASATDCAGNNGCDVVKSLSVGSSLCRVVLPDGATSVVGVADDQTVGALIERLLNRRNLVCNDYDIMVADPDKGTPTAIPPSTPAPSVRGREVRVVGRASVRVWAAGRGLGLRAAPGRPLGHALGPLLRRYAPGRRVVRVLRHPGGQDVPLDTTMQELDGARLKVIMDDEECARSTTSSPPHDDLDELGVRLHDDEDAQSGCSSTASGRVRAALRPGAPVHHHPPDFLDNLRSSQRARLQPRAAPLAPPSAAPPAPLPSPRAPPPLPPKPRTTPALV